MHSMLPIHDGKAEFIYHCSDRSAKGYQTDQQVQSLGKVNKLHGECPIRKMDGWVDGWMDRSDADKLSSCTVN